MECGPCGAYCSKCVGVKKAVLGVLILLNFFVWPKWTGFDGWVAFFGVLFLLGGIVRVLKPSCGCCNESCDMPAKKKGK